MYVKKIEIAKYRHIKDVCLGPFTAPMGPSEIIVLAGPNGGGKSSILELISLALSQAWSLTYNLNRTQPESSFEIQLGLLPKEIDLVTSYTATSDTQKEALEQLKTGHYYCRGFQYLDGEYEKNKAIHNAMYDIVQKVLKQDYKRPLGFHLGSDRVYEKEGFKNVNIFQYGQFTEPSYIWGFAYRTASAQYKDMFQFLVTWRYHYYHRLGRYQHQKDQSEDYMEEKPVDVYGNILKRVFPGYEFHDRDEPSPTDLFVKTPSGDIIPFSDLSSGEKEVLFMLCFFMRHNVEDAIISIDEPELHLHPSLVRQLVRTVQDIRPRNQIWLATHNSEVFDEAGRENTWFVRRRVDTQNAEIIHSIDEEEQLQALRDFFGYYGYIGLARKMVFLEGENSSADRKMLSRLFPQYDRDLKFIPSASCSQVERINSAILLLLETNFGHCEFFLIRDRDYMTENMVQAQKERGKGKLVVLDRHEIENYLIDFEIIAKVQTEIFDQATTPSDVRASLHNIARKIAGHVLRDMFAYRTYRLMNVETPSIGKFYEDVELIGEDLKWDDPQVSSLLDRFQERNKAVTDELMKSLGGASSSGRFGECKREVRDSLTSDKWLGLFPGKELITGYVSEHRISSVNDPSFINSIIKELSIQPDRIPLELRGIVDSIMSGGQATILHSSFHRYEAK